MSRPIRAIAFAGALMLALAACGGNSAENPTPTLPTLTEEATTEDTATTTTEAVDPEEAFQEYEACMQEHGIEMPDAQGGDGVVAFEDDGSFDIAAFEEASVACDPILEAAFGEFEMTPEQEAEFRDQELALAQCMRDNGIDWPDPGSDGSTVIDIGADVDPEDVNAALEACAPDIFGESGGIVLEDATP